MYAAAASLAASQNKSSGSKELSEALRKRELWASSYTPNFTLPRANIMFPANDVILAQEQVQGS